MLLAVFVAVLSFLLSYFLPWWAPAVAGVMAGLLLARSGWRAFGWGFAGISLLWLIETGAIYLLNDGLLANRVATIFSLSSGFFLPFISALLGGLMGGLSAMTGYVVRNLFSG